MPDDTPAAPDAPGAPPVATPPTPKAATVPTTTVKLRFPHDEFHSGVEGVPPITRQPTEIPTASLEAVQIAARKSRVTVTTIEEEK